MNPKIKDFLEENPHITLISLAWSLIWRLYLVILAGAFTIGVFAGLLDL